MAIGECPPKCIMQLFLFCPVQLSTCKYTTFFTQFMHLEVVETTVDIVGSFTTLSSLISEEIHLPRYRFAVDAEDSTLPWSKEVYRARLKWVRWKMDLLCIVERVVDIEFVGVGQNFGLRVEVSENFH